MTYIAATARKLHEILLRDAGRDEIHGAVDGCKISSVQTAGAHTVLPRSNGDAVACGDNSEGQHNLLYSHMSMLLSRGAFVLCGGMDAAQAARGDCALYGNRSMSPWTWFYLCF